MQFKYVSNDLTDVSTDLLALCATSDGGRDTDFKAVDKAIGKLLSERADELGFKGNRGETFVVRPHGGLDVRAIVVLGAGPKADLAAPVVRDLAADAVRFSTRMRAKKLAFVLPRAVSDAETAAQLAAEGIELGTYRFDKYRAEESRRPATIKSAQIVGTESKRAPMTKAIKRGRIVANAVKQARDFINEPAEAMTPAQLAAEARALGRKHKSLKVRVYSPTECEKLGMGMFLAVGRGSAAEPRLIHITYKPAKKTKKTVALIGKGVTFDSGGYSLKPSSGMLDMKIDMSGAAAVVAAMGAVAELGSPYEVHGITAAAENMVSGNAYRLGDVLTSMSGKTVEINNTDAEGRLTLGDALTFAREKLSPDEMFDFATLTGACMVALGPHTAGVMSNNDKLCKAWLDAADATGEDMWRLPLNPRLKEQLKSPIADMRNTGGRAGGALTAGLFLQEFVGDVPWVHVDIAGPASTSKAFGATSEGGVGFGVATMLEYLTR